MRQRPRRWWDCAGKPGRQVCRFVNSHCRSDLHHLNERHGALLHPRSAGGWRGQQWELFCRSTFDGGHDPLGRSNSDRTGEKAEFTGNYRDPTSPNGTDTGDDGLVNSALLAGLRQVFRVFRARSDVDGRGVPRDEALGIEYRSE